MAKIFVTGRAGFIGSHVALIGPAKICESRHIYLDSNKARREINWSPPLSLEEGLEKTVAYFKEVEQVN